MTVATNNLNVQANRQNFIKIVDVFSGIGGLSLGWINTAARHGIAAQLTVAIDADITLKPTFAHNFPLARFLHHQFGDPADKDETLDLLKVADVSRGDVDVLLAGPPCQTFSMAGKRERHADHRYVFHVCNLARILQPKIVLIENVTQFRSAEDGRIFGRVCVQLADAGYQICSTHLNASSYGVPQSRTRFFVIALHCELGFKNVSVLLQSLLNPLDRELGTPMATTVADAISDLPPLASGEGMEESSYIREPESHYQQLMRQSQATLLNHVAAYHSAETVAAMSLLSAGERPVDSENHPMRSRSYFRAAYARLSPDAPASTITTQTQNPGSGRFTHYRDNRVLTVREAARLQSFPDSFRFLGGPSVQRRHVGNAVPPLLASAIAQQLLPLI